MFEVSSPSLPKPPPPRSLSGEGGGAKRDRYTHGTPRRGARATLYGDLDRFFFHRNFATAHSSRQRTDGHKYASARARRRTRTLRENRRKNSGDDEPRAMPVPVRCRTEIDGAATSGSRARGYARGIDRAQLLHYNINIYIYVRVHVCHRRRPSNVR